MASVFDTPVDRDQQRADQLLELVKWASGLRGAQTMGKAYGPAVSEVVNSDALQGRGAFAPGGAVQGFSNAVGAVGIPAGAIPAGLRGVGLALNSGGTGLGSSGKTGMYGGAISPPNLLPAARGIAKKAQDVDDVMQSGHVAGQKLISTKGGTGKDYMYKARSEMKHWSPSGSQGMGIRTQDRLDLEAAVAKAGDQGSDKILAILEKKNPGYWTIDKIQRARGGVRQMASIDDAETPLSGVLEASSIAPDKLVEIRQKLEGMTKAVRRDAEALINGDIKANELHPQKLARIQAAMSDEPKQTGGSDWYQRAAAQHAKMKAEQARKQPILPAKPISGGSDAADPRAEVARLKDVWKAAMGTDQEQVAYDAWNTARKSPELKAQLDAEMRGISDMFKKKPISGGSDPLPPRAADISGLNPEMQKIQDDLKFFLDKTYPEGQVMSPSWKAESGLPGHPMSGVTNPYHKDFIELQNSAPKVARALQRLGDNSEFGPDMGAVSYRSLPKELFKRGDREGWGFTSSKMNPQREIAINPDPTMGKSRTTPIHEALHALYQMTKREDGPNPEQGRKIASWLGRASENFPRGKDGSYGMKLMEGMYADDPGHAAIETMTNNILRKTGQKPVYRKLD